MKKKICFPLALLLLTTACGSKPEIHTGAQTPAPVTGEGTMEVAPSPEPTTEPVSSPMPTPTMAPTPSTTLEEWTAAMPDNNPEYTIEEGDLRLQDFVAWPEQPVTLEIPGWYAGRSGRGLRCIAGNAAGVESRPGNIGTRRRYNLL